ncbi:unnamed protein product, partial [Ixodes pacificus]
MAANKFATHGKPVPCMVFPQRHGPQGTTRRSGICGGCTHADSPPHKWRSGRGHCFCPTLWQGMAAYKVSSLATEKTGGLAEARPACTSIVSLRTATFFAPVGQFVSNKRGTQKGTPGGRGR